MTQKGFAHLLIIILLLLGLVVGVYLATHQQLFNSKAANEANEVVTLTQQLVNYSTQRSNFSSQGVNNIASIISRRKELMVNLMSQNPAKFLDLVVTPQIRSAIPQELQASVESQQNISGDLTVLDNHAVPGGYSYYLKNSNDDISVYFENPNPDLSNDTQVRLTGYRLGNDLLIADNSNDIKTTNSRRSSAVSGDYKIAALVGTFGDNSKPSVDKDLLTTIFTPGVWLPRYFDYLSNGKLKLSADVFDQVPITARRNAAGQVLCEAQDYQRWDQEMDNYLFSKNYFFGGKYKTVMMFFPIDSYAFCPPSGTQGDGSMGRVYVYGITSQDYVYGNQLIHELGHNLGFWHADKLICSKGNINQNCQRQNYGDPYDIMSNTPPDGLFFNAASMYKAGWINDSEIIDLDGRDITSPYTIVIPALYPYSTNAPKKAVRIRLSNGFSYSGNTASNLWLTYNPVLETDGTIKYTNSGVPDRSVGVQMRYKAGSESETLFVPIPGSGSNQIFQDGITFNDNINNLSLTQISHDRDGAVMRIAPIVNSVTNYSIPGSKISAKCISRSTDDKCVTARITWDNMGDFISGDAKWFLVRADETQDTWNGPRNVKPILDNGAKNLDSGAWTQKKGDNFVDLDVSGGQHYSVQVQGFMTDRTDQFYSDSLATNIYNESYAQKELKRIGQITLFSDLKISDIGANGLHLPGSEIAADCIGRDANNKCNRIRVKWDSVADLYMQKYVSWYLVRADDQKDGWKGPDDVAVWNTNNRDRYVDFNVNPDDNYYVSVQGFYSDRPDSTYNDNLGIYTYWDSYYIDGAAKLDKASNPRQTKRIGNVTLFSDLDISKL